MLALLFAWALIAGLCVVIGTAVLARTGPPEALQRRGDRAVVAVWLGMLVLAWALLTVALFTPLTPAAGVVVAAALVLASLAATRTREQLASLLHRPSPSDIWGLLAIAVAVAFLAVDDVSLYDTALYHYPLTKWLREHGVVIGVALVYDALGQGSIWPALHAPWIGGVFTDRMANVWTSFLWLTVAVHAMLCVRRIAERRGLMADCFFVVMTFLLSGRLIGLVLSASADAPILALGASTLWLILLIEAGPTGTATRSRVVDERVIPLLIAAGALAIKPNALPLAAIAGLYYVGWPWTVKRIATGFAIGVVTMAPVIAMGLMSGGCPLFPSPTLCLDAPWAVEPDRLRLNLRYFREFVLRGDVSGPLGVGLENWPALWIRKQVPGVFFFFATLAVIPPLLRGTSRGTLPGGRWVIAYAVVAITFVLITAPAQRYMVVGYTAAPALYAAWLFQRWWTRPDRETARIVWPRLSQSTVALLLIVGALGGLTVLQSLRFNPRSAIRGAGSPLDLTALPWLLPSRLPNGPVFPARAGDFDYFTPVDVSKLREQLHSYSKIPQDLVSVRCWAAPLPCSPYLTYDDVVLRDPRRGIGGGFVRRSRIGTGR